MMRTFPSIDNKKALGFLFSNKPIGIAYQTTLRPWQAEVKEALAFSQNIEKTIEALLILHHHFAEQIRTAPYSMQQYHLIKTTINITGVHPEPRAYVESILLIKKNITNIASLLYPMIRQALEKSPRPMTLAVSIIQASKALLLDKSNVHGSSNLNALIRISSYCSNYSAIKNLWHTLEAHHFNQPMLDTLCTILDESVSPTIKQDNVFLALEDIHTPPLPQTSAAFFSPIARRSIQPRSTTLNNGDAGEMKVVVSGK